MKVEFLKNLGLDEEVIKAIQAESGKDVTAAKTAMQSQIDTLNGQITDLQGQVTQRDTDLKDVKDKLEKAGQSSTKLGELQTSLTDLQSKYDADTKAYQKKLDDQAYEFKVTQRADKIDFSCNAAKREFVGNLMKDRLPLSDGELLGFDDYVNKQRQADPDAFKPVTPPDNQNPEQKPNFAPPANPANNQQAKEVDFGFNFVGVRKHD